jgi:hypothetical protein
MFSCPLAWSAMREGPKKAALQDDDVSFCALLLSSEKHFFRAGVLPFKQRMAKIEMV